MPISCHFQDCEALLFVLITCKQRYIKYPGFTFFSLATDKRLVKLLSVSRFPVVSSLAIEKHHKPSVNSNNMDEDRNRKDVARSHSDGGPLRRVRDPGGLESEGLTIRSGSVLKSRTLHMSQISDPHALAEPSALTAQGHAVLSQSESESAITHAVSAAAADPSLASLPDDKQLEVPASVSSVLTASLAMPIVISHW